MKRRLTIMLAVVGMLTSAGIAAAAEEDPEDRDDTVFNYGYDEENHVLLWGAHATDGLYDCTIEVEGLTVTYGLTVDGLVTVDGLTQGEGVVTFSPTDSEDLDEDLQDQAVTEGATYSGPEGPCIVSGGVVEGPNGQVNHGMIMKLFNEMYEGPGRGCLVRHLAKSDLGKHDQQINVPDVEDDGDEPLEGIMATIDFESVLADCEHGNAENEDKLTGQENAAAKKAAALERRGNSGDAPGKSGEAPGRNKDNGEG